MGSLVVSIAVVLVLLPIMISWFAVIFAPFLLIMGIPLVPILFLAFPEFLSASKEDEIAKAKAPVIPKGRSEPTFPSFACQKGRIEDLIRRKLNQLRTPFRACACLSTDHGNTVLVARFIDGHHSFSHRVRGVTLEDAISRLEWKLFQEREGTRGGTIEKICGGRPGQCAFRACANFAACPRRVSGSPFEEVAEVVA